MKQTCSSIAQLLLLGSLFTTGVAQLSLCSNHLGTKDLDNFQPVLLQKWDEPNSDGGSQSPASFNVDYLPRVDGFTYEAEAEDSDYPSLNGLDLIVKDDDQALLDETVRDKTPTFTFHRGATVFMLVTASKEYTLKSEPAFPGWNSLGWYNKGASSKSIVDIGIRLIRSIPLDETVFVFSKNTDESNSIELPSMDLVYRRSKLLNKRERFNQVLWLVGEDDGSPSLAPDSPYGVPTIIPGQTCPSELHDLWRLPASSSPSFPDFASDPDLTGQDFATWHPIFDPCYWCAYDHEHGSDASTLIGQEFAPHYTYTAWKNHRQDESVPGFKSFVFRYKKYMIIYDVHMQNSQPRRFQTPIHTGTMTIVDVKTDPDSPKLMLKLTKKLDFGPLEVMIDDDGNFLSANETESALFAESNRGKFHRGRLVNSDTTNSYEKWDTKPMCALDSGRQTVFRVRITNTPTALDNYKNVAGPSEYSAIPLYRDIDGYAMHRQTRQVGMRRQLIMMNVTLGTDHCATEIDGFESVYNAHQNGVFYTDPMGTQAFSKPGPTRMWQFIDPKFRSFKVDGKNHVKMESAYETLFTDNDFNFPDNVPLADALDPEVN